MSEIEKFPLSSADIKDQQLEKLKALFPEVFTEGNKVDWDKFKLTLGEAIDGGKERFGMNWPGKADCFKTIQQTSLATLVPVREESVGFDKTENLFIEGDNLEVLKLLQKSYLGKIKMVYIDPPYNTGNDFIYPDNYSESLESYLEYTGQADSAGKKFSTNTDTDGRFHSKWMNMMYPRLFLAKNLLQEDGVIFISIDDNEVSNLRLLGNEIFGEENFLSQFVWRTAGNFDNQAKVKKCHEYVLSYCKDISRFPHPPVINPSVSEKSKLFKTEIRNTIVKNGPANPVSEIKLPIGFKADFESGIIEARDDKWPKYLNTANVENYKLKNEVIVASGWSSKELIEEFINSNFTPILDNKQQETTFVITKTGAIEVIKNRLSAQSYVISVITNVGNTQSTSANLKSDGIFFDYPKPIELVKYLVKMNCGAEFFALDFFAGSCTTANAILDLNEEDGGNRRFICVQIPEPTDKNSEAFKAGYKTIADIGKERIRRVIKNIRDKAKQKPNMFSENNKKHDLGFKVFKLAKSNFALWNADVDKTLEAIQQQLSLHVQHISPEAQQESILFELLLKSGIPITTPVNTIVLSAGKGKKSGVIYTINDNELVICLEKQLTHELIKGIADLKPQRVICLDEGFQNNDQLKTNAALIMKSKGIIKFQTV
jgi:adenine-specific DNA-methyltransferase